MAFFYYRGLEAIAIRDVVSLAWLYLISVPLGCYWWYMIIMEIWAGSAYCGALGSVRVWGPLPPTIGPYLELLPYHY